MFMGHLLKKISLQIFFLFISSLFGLKLLCFSLKLYFVNILVLEIKRRERECVLKKIMGERESSWFPRSLEQKKTQI